jgi:hypothetical protein
MIALAVLKYDFCTLRLCISAIFWEFFVHAVASQAAATEEMEGRAFNVQPMHSIKDKRARPYVAGRKMGVVKFPRTGCERLSTHLLGLGGTA